MRRFVVYSSSAQTAGRIRDLKSAGRIDILLHSIISALFSSHSFREDVELHLILMGPPTPPRHIIIRYDENSSISKKDLKWVIEVALRRFKKGITREVHPGVFVDDKSLEVLIDEFNELCFNMFFLNENGKFIREFEKNILLNNPVFILGDHDGFKKSLRRFLKKSCYVMSLGKRVYFTSQVITIINYELDSIE